MYIVWHFVSTLTMKTLLAYVVSFTVMAIVAYLPQSVTAGAVTSPWYQCIQPSFSPPKYVFPVVWTILYVFLGVTLAQTLMLPESSGKYWLLGFYAYNLVQNVSWSYVFFGEHEVKLALFILGEMLLSTGLILWQTYRLLPAWVGNLLVPYMAWLMFATTLNIDMLFKTC